MSKTPEFIDVCAVEAWDAWFRWRERDELKDVSIQDTWGRVARALATRDTEQRLLDAMETWRLLLDERILATAGTQLEAWPDNELAAVINVVVFVGEPGMPGDSLDLAAIERTASLAVEILENAIQKARLPSAQTGHKLRIGLIGFADALALMDIPYASQCARLLARKVSLSMARGSLKQSIDLARQLGPRVEISEQASIASRLRELAPDLAQEAALHGLRHYQLTAVAPHPRLARLANNVADAIDPLEVAQEVLGLRGEPAYSTASQGYAIEWSRGHGMSDRHIATMKQNAFAAMSSRMALRDAVQEWIDEPMDRAKALRCEARTGISVEADAPRHR
ncbi:hypothetical protein [Dyella japonica]|uniref:Ribonucleoside-diphosphate reductase alpha chain n=1 Tax=Dyella japonica TaxID=231455 RepID=A0ABV2JP28_9GAMM